MINNSRYSQHARHALSQARALAKDFAHPAVDSTHLLIGILREQGSIGYNILQDLEMDLRRTERAFHQVHPQTGTPSNAIQPLTPALHEALQLASDESH